MWKKIKEFGKGVIKVLNLLYPLLLWGILIYYLFKEDLTFNDFMWFLFFLVMYGTDKIVDAIKEKK